MPLEIKQRVNKPKSLFYKACRLI